MTGPTLASMYPVPQRYYVPQRIREDYYFRLSASGMTSAPSEVEEKPNQPFRNGAIPRLRGGIKKDDKIRKAFEREKVFSFWFWLLWLNAHYFLVDIDESKSRV
jgi:sorting and assembly machinery component 37